MNATSDDNAEMAKALNLQRGVLHVVDDEDLHVPRFVRLNDELGPTGQFLIDLKPPFSGIEYVPKGTAEQGYEFRVKPGSERLPVVQVTWFGAHMYCAALGKRLPTENEWEAAARGRDNRKFPWGDAMPRCGEVNIPRDGRLPISPDCPETVSLLPISTAKQDVTPEGVHDLAGNVAEWVDAVFVEGDRTANPPDPAGLRPRVIRGGSTATSLRARTTARSEVMPNIAATNVGFRCAGGSSPSKEGT